MMRIQTNPSLQDKSTLTEVLQKGGDVSDRLEVMGEYVLQFGKYKGKLYSITCAL